jgi:hypothetical protein
MPAYRIEQHRPGTEEEQKLVEEVLRVASPLMVGRVTGLVILSSVGEVTGNPKDGVVRLVSHQGTRGYNLRLLDRFVHESTKEIPTGREEAS